MGRGQQIRHSMPCRNQMCNKGEGEQGGNMDRRQQNNKPIMALVLRNKHCTRRPRHKEEKTREWREGRTGTENQNN